MTATAVRSVAGGLAHTCALTTAGGLKCWGANAVGQLGNGLWDSSSSPVDVTGLASGVRAVTAGGAHACASLTAGGVTCWGLNTWGQLGSAAVSISSLPVAVPGLTGVVSSVAAGYSHTCAVSATGGVTCWGANSVGQLGHGDRVWSMTPVDVTRLGGGVSAVSAGGDHACALTSAGAVLCWGANFSGQLGNGTTTLSSTTPAPVVGLTSGVRAVAAGNSHTCALTAAGGVMCWGSNGTGALGNGLWTSSTTPVAVVGLASGASALAAGEYHMCAITSGGAVKCWGQNDTGQLGNGLTTNSNTPVDVSGLASGASAVAGGRYHTCAVVAGGVKCWGANTNGQLGNGTTTPSGTPVNVTGLTSGVIAVAAGYSHSCAVTTAGAVKCWGYNFAGQLGNGSTLPSTTPVDVSGLTSGVIAVTAADYHSCALTSAGGVKCWGWNVYGQLGNGMTTYSPRPVDVTGLTSGVLSVDAGTAFTCAVTSIGSAQCWGDNGNGALGSGLLYSSTPLSVVDGTIETAVYDATLKVPACAEAAAGCDSSSRISGRDTIAGGAEMRQPNTLFSSCADGTQGQYLFDESIERIRVATLDGSVLAPGKTVQVEVTVFAYGDFTSDWLDLYYTGTAASPSWTWLATVPAVASGLQTLSATYVLPSGSLQAIRAAFRYQGTPSPCWTGNFNERDDLAFATAAPDPAAAVQPVAWRHAATGQNYLWNLRGGGVVSGASLLAVSDPGWEMAATADFNGDGLADLVWRHVATGQNAVWYMNGATFLGPAPLPAVADPAWQLVAAVDVDGDGHPDLVWHHAATGQNAVWYLSGTSIVATASLPTVADPLWQMVGAADFNGDGHPDLVWRHLSTGENGVWYMDGVTKVGDAGLPAAPDLRWYVAAVGDSNGDGHPDLVWRNAATGENVVWGLNGTALVATASLPTVADTSWDAAGRRARPVPVKAPSDFNRDGQVDLLWRHAVSGATALWHLNGSTLVSTASLPSAADPSWQLVGSADLNRDGLADLIWRQTTTGQHGVWYMNGPTVAWSASLLSAADATWQLAAVADFNADGKSDFVLRNTTTGLNVIWLMNGAAYWGHAALPTVADTNWRIVAAADFNADGKPDLVWRHLATGLNAVWYMDGTTKAGDALLPMVADPAWQIAMAADFNADGKPDLVWRNYTTGQNVIWLMNGVTYLMNAPLPAVTDTNWMLLRR